MQSPFISAGGGEGLVFNRSNSGGVSWILVGLGNPGKQYESTRHNMGWLALDSLMEMENFKLSKLRFKAWTGILEKTGIRYW